MQKHFEEHPVLGTIALHKRRSQRHIRISVEQDGHLRVSLPYWVPYKAGIAFALTKHEWIVKQRQTHKKTSVLEDDISIGKHHLLVFSGIEEGEIRSRVTSSHIHVRIPDRYDFKDQKVQLIVRRACERALLQEAEELLPDRVTLLAAKHQYTFTSVAYKKLKRRWGSCDSQGNLVFNIFLMQLPWDLIDYVIIHELVHTKHMHHQPIFWNEVESILPSYKSLRKNLKTHVTAIL